MTSAARGLRYPIEAFQRLLDAHPFARDAWEGATSETLQVRVANLETALSRSDSLAMLEWFLEPLTASSSGFWMLWEHGEAAFVETEMEFRRLDGGRERVPCAIIARSTHGVLRDLRFHLHLPTLLMERPMVSRPRPGLPLVPGRS